MRRKDWVNRTGSLSVFVVVVFLVHATYLFVAGSASIVYVANVLMHVPAGLAAIYLITRLIGSLVNNRKLSRLVFSSLVISVLAGVAVLVTGNTNESRWLLVAHVVACIPVVVAVLSLSLMQNRRKSFRIGAVVAILLSVGMLTASLLWPDAPENTIVNEILPPLTMADAAMNGSSGPFFPSPASTSNGQLIPETYFTESESCGVSGCHSDAYSQWNRSAHRFSSFNNQWYRKSIEYMQEVAGTQAAQWCAGCHDHALLFSGQMNQPVEDFIDSNAANAGLACVSCHAIKEVKNTGGNGAFVIEYPKMHDLATSDNRILKTLHDLTLRLDPEPHRATFTKPFQLKQPSEFCSTCHKVHLDKEVNDYRWIRGFNTYDNWQASGVSHEGARSFYQPESPQNCVSCHMPSVESSDPGNDHGAIKSHDFIAANTGLAVANQDDVQLSKTRSFLTSNKLSVDIFAVSTPEYEPRARTASDVAPEEDEKIETTFAVGDEGLLGIGVGSSTSEAVDVLGPLSNGAAVLRNGSTVRLDVVVRTLALGHFFPTGTVDALEAWLEVKVENDDGDVIFWSGFQDANGYVDPSAHFYRTLMIDERGNPIDKRNAFASRSVVYVNLIPPGSADVGHFQLKVPEDVEALNVTAKLNYRKFIKEHTSFAYSGVMDNESGEYSTSYDDRHWTAEELSSVSGALQSVPDLPVVVMAQDSKRLLVGDGVVEADDTAFGRWTDYGIGLFRQGDLKGAIVAFEKASEIDPLNPEPLVNLARCYLGEGNIERANEVLSTAATLDDTNHKVQFFTALAKKAVGDYESARSLLASVEKRFPRDRVVLNQIGRVQYLSEEYDAAVNSFERVLRIDAEDLMAHYNLMIIQRARGDLDRSLQHELRYQRYKADESSASLALEYRREHPLDNNEALQIHAHDSFWNARARDE